MSTAEGRLANGESMQAKLKVTVANNLAACTANIKTVKDAAALKIKAVEDATAVKLKKVQDAAASSNKVKMHDALAIQTF